MIWVLTAGFGDGHNTAARCVADALRHEAPAEHVQVSDFVSEVHPRAAKILKSAYQVAIIRFPDLWKAAYKMLAKPSVSASGADWMQPLIQGLKRRILSERPRAIVSTYPMYAGPLHVLRRSGFPVPPVITVVTDSVSIHPVWLCAPSDLYLVADEETRNVMMSAFQVPPDKVAVSGFPVSLAFLEPLSAPSGKKGGQRLLYFPSTPAVHVEQTLQALRPQLQAGLELTLPLGKHGHRLYHTLRKFMDANPAAKIETIGWTSRIPELLRTHDALITKAGGAILHEVLAARIPAVIDYVVPGQEEGNAEILLKHECALRSRTPEETADCVKRLLEDEGRLALRLRENMKELSVPDAALRAARIILERCPPVS